MPLIFLSFIAGLLTVLSPCTVATLPVILGGSLASRSRLRPLVMIASFGVSVVIFTLVLKVSTSLLAVPVSFWQVISGTIVLLVGLFMLFPDLWTRLEVKLRLSESSARTLRSATLREDMTGAVLTGFALGPIFTSCSPTYGLIVAAILPVSLGEGSIYLLVYTLALCLVLLGISLLGQTLVGRIRFLADPHGAARRIAAVLFIIFGLLIITGIAKELEVALLDGGYVNLTELELGL